MTTDFQAPKRNLKFTRGDDETFSITRTQEDGTAFDLTGWTFWLTVKNDLADSDADAVIQKTVTSHTNPQAGKTRISLAASDTKPLSGLYEYDIQEETDTGAKRTLVRGNIYFSAEVTQS